MGSTGIPSYSTTPIENETTDGTVTWKEGQLPSTVNNSKRQALTDLRNAFNDLAWFDYGTGTQNTSNHLGADSVYVSATSFYIEGADVTAAYHAGRRVRAMGSTTGTIYGTISSSSYSSGTTRTTVVVSWDTSSSLQNETLTICISQVPGVAVNSLFDIVVRAGADGGDPLGTGNVDDYPNGFAFTILRNTVENDVSGSVTWDVRVNTFAVDDPPISGESIVASAPPSTASHQSSRDSTLSGWTPAVAADSQLRFVLTAVDGVVARSTLTLKCRKT